MPSLPVLALEASGQDQGTAWLSTCAGDYIQVAALREILLCCRDRAHKEDEQRYNTAHALADNHIAEEAAAAGRAGNTLPF